MPRLNNVTADQAEGELKEIYDGLTRKMGKVINIFQAMGNSAAALKAYLNMSSALADGDLAPEDREAIYLAVSEHNNCNYCVSAHTVIAKKVGIDGDEILNMRRHEPSDPKRHALVHFVLRVMATKGFVEDAELAAVRDAGYSDGQIAEAIAYIGLATYSNLFNHVHATELDFPEAPAIS